MEDHISKNYFNMRIGKVGAKLKYIYIITPFHITTLFL